MTTSSARRRPTAFTLVELLVVIGIIAILISILLPSLARARQAAQTVACAANLRSILQATHIFASQNKGDLPGSVYTSARFMFRDPRANPASNGLMPGVSETNLPTIVQTADWASPLAKVMRVQFNEGSSSNDRLARFETMRNLPQFTCPSNEVISGPYSGSTLKCAVGRMPSYTAALGFLLQRSLPTASGGGDGVWGLSTTRPEWQVPAGYNCKISKVGDPARKVFMADGAKFSTPTIAPDSDLNITGGMGGAFADQGPTKFSRAWARDRVQGNGTTTGVDTRVFWARHGGRAGKPGGKAGTFRFNIAFFDGHVETVDDLTGANPFFYWPKGTQLTVNTNQFYNDQMTRFFPGGAPPQPIIIP